MLCQVYMLLYLYRMLNFITKQGAASAQTLGVIGENQQDNFSHIMTKLAYVMRTTKVQIRLIIAFIVRCLDSIILIVAMFRNYKAVASVAEKFDLSHLMTKPTK